MPTGEIRDEIGTGNGFAGTATRVIAAAIAFVATANLVGWWLAAAGVPVPDVSRVVAGAPAMRANGALAFVLATLSLGLSLRGWEAAARIPASLVAAIGVATLFEHVSGLDLGIDQLLVVDRTGDVVPPGRFASNSALGFLLIGAALLLRRPRPGAADRAGEVLGLAIGIVALPPVIGYFYDVRGLTSLFGPTSVAPPSAVAFVALSVAIVMRRPDRGIAKILGGSGPGGMLLRGIVPVVVIGIVVLGGLEVVGERLDLFDSGLGMGLFVAAAIGLVVSLAVSSASWLEHVEGGRQRATESLRQSEQRLRATFYNAGVGIAETDADERFVAVNPRFCEITGYACEGLLGLSVQDLTHPDDRAEAAERNRRLREGLDSGIAYEKRYLRADGTPVWVVANATAVRDPEGRFVRAVVVLREIDERRRAEEELRRSERRHRSLVEATAAIVWDMPASGEFATPQPAWSAFTGRTWAALRGWGWLDAIHPDDRAATAAAWKHAVATRTPYQFEHRVERHDGVYRHMRARAVPIVEGDTCEWVGVHSDVDDLVRTRRNLDETSSLLRALSDATTDVFIVKDLDGRVLFANPAVMRGLRRPLEQILGRTTRELLADAEAVALAEGVERAVIASGKPQTAEIPMFTASGRYVYLVTNSPMRDDAGRIVGVAISGRDITDRKRMEEMLAVATVSAERAKAVAEDASRAKDHFLAVLSHELRTPLTPVVAVMAMLEEREWDDATRQQLDMVRRNVELEARLIDDLLDLTRIARGKVDLDKRRVDLRDVVARAVEVCRPDIDSRGVHFDVDLGPQPCPVDADSGRLQQVFWNLLKNAVKFTPRDGCIGISCRPEGRSALVEVHDSGIGIDASALPHVFDAFEQANRSITREFGGLGLGLTISKALVELHGGSIAAHSEGRGRGASIRVRLPLSASEEKRRGRSAEEATAARGAPGQRVLLVEDHGDSAAVMRLALVARGYEVETAGDVATAIELLECGPFDVLVSDIGLPDGSGHDLMRRLRERGHALPGIALSGYGQDDDVRRSHAAGFALHLVKPVRPAVLAAAVAQVSDPGADADRDGAADGGARGGRLQA